MSFSVNHRVSEMGVRMALGANAGQVIRLIIRQGLSQIAIGLLLGTGLAVLVANGLTLLLYQVQPWDPTTFAGVLVLLTITGLGASAIPAVRATKVDPMVALQAEQLAEWCAGSRDEASRVSRPVGSGISHPCPASSHRFPSAPVVERPTRVKHPARKHGVEANRLGYDPGHRRRRGRVHKRGTPRPASGDRQGRRRPERPLRRRTRMVEAGTGPRLDLDLGVRRRGLA
jgi:hypothetical protein